MQSFKKERKYGISIFNRASFSRVSIVIDIIQAKMKPALLMSCTSIGTKKNRIMSVPLLLMPSISLSRKFVCHDRGIGNDSIIYFEFFTAVLLNYYLRRKKCAYVMKNELCGNTHSIKNYSMSQDSGGANH